MKNITSHSTFSTSPLEIKELAKAWFFIAVSFAILFSNLFESFLLAVGVSALTVGVGFLFHELAHKLVAQRYGCWAEFRASNFWLFAMLAMSLLGFIFAAPGATVISGKPSPRRYGKISAAGPIANLVLAVLFSLFFLVGTQLFTVIALFGFGVNSLLALFNMIPFGNLDGKKVLLWGKVQYGIITGISAVFCGIASYLIYA